MRDHHGILNVGEVEMVEEGRVEGVEITWSEGVVSVERVYVGVTSGMVVEEVEYMSAESVLGRIEEGRVYIEGVEITSSEGVVSSTVGVTSGMVVEESDSGRTEVVAGVKVCATVAVEIPK